MLLAIVRVRGIRGVIPKIKKTFELLKLIQTNHCVLVNESPAIKGMINVIKDYVAFGPLSQETLEMVLTNKGKVGSKMLKTIYKPEEITKLTADAFSGKPLDEKINRVFCMRPPSKGYKNTKLPWPMGALGKRTEMDTILRRMM